MVVIIVIFILQLEDAKHKTPTQIQQALDDGKSSKENIKVFQQQREEILVKAEKKVENIKPLAEHLSHFADQIADIERFRTYISWIQKLEAVRYVLFGVNVFVWFVESKGSGKQLQHLHQHPFDLVELQC